MGKKPGRKKNAIPSYLLHSSSGQARVRIDGKDHLLGEYDSEESKIRYAELISGTVPVKPADADEEDIPAVDQGVSVNEICLSFLTHAKTHYVKNGKPTSELYCFKSCIKVLRELYGMAPANTFGPKRLKTVRAKMIDLGWARGNINRMVCRIRQIFKYAIEEELIGGGDDEEDQRDVIIMTRLKSVAPLLAGKTEAHDNAPREALEVKAINAVKKLVRPLVADLIDLQLHTGARSGELVALTPSTINRSGKTWKSVLADHKTVHHGARRAVHFGPKAKVIIEKRMAETKPGGKLFPITRTAYCRAVTRACDKAGIERWTPHWLRHTFCTRVREKLGIEAAQSMAGHTKSQATADYAKKMDRLAAKTAATVG